MTLEKVIMEIYVGNLSYDASEGDLQDKFEQYGVVSQLKIITDRETGRSRGFAFVTMESDDDARNAIESLNGEEFLGRELSIREATPRAPRTGGGGPRGGGFRPRGGGGGGFRGGDNGGDRGGDRRGGGGGDRRRGGRSEKYGF